jgi:hypothetical protein
MLGIDGTLAAILGRSFRRHLDYGRTTQIWGLLFKLVLLRYYCVNRNWKMCIFHVATDVSWLAVAESHIWKSKSSSSTRNKTSSITEMREVEDKTKRGGRPRAAFKADVGRTAWPCKDMPKSGCDDPGRPCEADPPSIGKKKALENAFCCRRKIACVDTWLCDNAQLLDPED